MDAPRGRDGAPGFPGPINLGNPVEFSMRELAELVISITGSSSIITHHPMPADDPAQRRPDIRRAQDHLHWTPSVSLADGLTRTIAHFDTLLRAG